jgi:hypothetical protein
MQTNLFGKTIGRQQTAASAGRKMMRIPLSVVGSMQAHSFIFFLLDQFMVYGKSIMHQHTTTD